MKRSVFVATLLLAACGGKDVAPPLVVRDAGRDMALHDSGVDADLGASLDAETNDADVDLGPPRNLVDFSLMGEGFADEEALTVYARLEDRVRGLYSDVSSGEVASGSFVIEMPSAFDRDLFGMQLHVYFDTSLNSVCDPAADSLVQVMVPTPSGEGAVSFYLENGAPANEPGTCDVF